MNTTLRVRQAERRTGSMDGRKKEAIDDAAIAMLSTDDLRALVIQDRLKRGGSLAIFTPEEIAKAKRRAPAARRTLDRLRRRCVAEVSA